MLHLLTSFIFQLDLFHLISFNSLSSIFTVESNAQILEGLSVNLALYSWYFKTAQMMTQVSSNPMTTQRIINLALRTHNPVQPLASYHPWQVSQESTYPSSVKRHKSQFYMLHIWQKIWESKRRKIIGLYINISYINNDNSLRIYVIKQFYQQNKQLCNIFIEFVGGRVCYYLLHSSFLVQRNLQRQTQLCLKDKKLLVNQHRLFHVELQVWKLKVQFSYIYQVIIKNSFYQHNVFLNNIQICLLMRNRNKLDWSKPFKFIENRKIFDQIDTNDETLIIVINTQQEKVPKKEDILVPKIDTVKRISEVKKFAKLTSNYIRLKPQLNLPNASNYQLTEVDHTFLRSHQDKFLLKGKKILTEQFLRKVFIELQLKAGKDMTLPRSKGWMMAFLEKQCKELLQMDGIETFAQKVYNYWKSRREELRFPLLRLLWKPTPDQYNHMLAFRPRERDKRSLRRTNRVVEDEIIEELFEEFYLTLKLVDRIQIRQELKFKQIQLQLSGFYTQCKNFISQPTFLSEFKPQERIKDKQKIKLLNYQIQNYRSRKQTLDIFPMHQNGNELDQKLTTVNFLSTVIYEAELLGISYEKIYFPNNCLVQEKSKNFINPPSYDLLEVPIQGLIAQQKNTQLEIKVSLHRFNNLIFRQIQQDQSPINHVKPCKDYLQYKRRNVDHYYLGSDDQGQSKDVKKNTSINFKRFLQMQQIQQVTRTVSMLSEN